MNKEVSAPETGNWRSRGIRDRERNEGHNVISGDNQGKTHNGGKSIDTLLWKPTALPQNGPACSRCPQGWGGRGGVDARYPLPAKQPELCDPADAPPYKTPPNLAPSSVHHWKQQIYVIGYKRSDSFGLLHGVGCFDSRPFLSLAPCSRKELTTSWSSLNSQNTIQMSAI